MNRRTPLISVVIPVCNGERFVDNAIASVRSQNYPRLDIIVVDDGSTDKTPAILERHLADDLRVIRQSNQGQSVARNVGIEAARGELLSFLDVDDLWAPRRLEPMVREMAAAPHADMVLGHSKIVRYDNGMYEEFGKPFLMPFLIGSALYRPAVFEKVGLFDVELRYGEDTDWYSRALETNLIMITIDQVVLFYTRHGQNLTNRRNGNAPRDLGMFDVIRRKLARQKQTGGVK